MLAWLFDRFSAAAEKTALIWRDRSFTYAWLLEKTRTWQAELDLRNIQSGTVVALEGDYSPEVCALLLALVDRGAIVVPLTSAVESSKPQFQEIAEVQAGFRFTLGTLSPTWDFNQHLVIPTNPLTRRLIDSRDPGLVLFSSGSTGKPKAALHNFARLLEKFKTQRHSLRTITFLLLDHIGGINTLFYILSNAGTIISIEGRSPDEVCAAIQQHRVELLPTTPTFLNLLLVHEAYHRYDLSSLKQITYGTEVMPESTLKRVHALLPAVTLLQTYGLSELGIMRSKSRDSNSLWVKLGGEGFETKIVDGTLHIRAQSAMLGYLNAPSPFDADGWFNTGDEVLVDGEYLQILGRRSEVINVGGEKVHPAEVESVLLQLPNVRDVAVIGQPNPLTGNIVSACFQLQQPEPLPALRQRMREFCRDKLTPFKIPAKIEIVTADQYSERFKKMRRRTVAPTA